MIGPIINDQLAARRVAWERRRRPRALLGLETTNNAPESVSRSRVMIMALLYAIGFSVLSGRLVMVTLLDSGGTQSTPPAVAQSPTMIARAEILDRNGIVLATDLETQSLFADARLVRDPARLATALAAEFPELDVARLRNKLASGLSFVWLKRNLTPRQVFAVNSLGQPALAFKSEKRRVYPQGRLLSHVVGYTDVDNHGLGGVEGAFDDELQGAPTSPLRLSLDVRFQHVLHDELSRAMDEFRAAGAAGLIVEATTGEVVAMASLPDFDPQDPGASDKANLFNRATLGVYEMGSTFKAITIAMALESGVATIHDGYDASTPLRLARYTIRDYHAKNRWLSVPEILMYSSNIGAAKMALDVGAAGQRAFLDKLGLLAPLGIELEEAARPIMPDGWGDVTTATVSFGHGVAVSPLHLARAFAALVNGGVLHTTTVLASTVGPMPAPVRVVTPQTSRQMRRMLRLVVAEGTGRQADIAGYLVGGKTGTAEKAGERGYDRRRLLSSFVAAFPMSQPRYVVLAVLDEPQGTAATHNYATGGWTAAPVVGRIIARVAPMAGILPLPPTAPEAVEANALLPRPQRDGIQLAAY